MSSISEHSDSEQDTRKRTNKSDIIAFLPITAGQKHSYNSKGLQSQLDVFFTTVRASLVDAGVDLSAVDETAFQTLMHTSIMQAYAAPIKRKVARSAWNFYNEEQHKQYKGRNMTMPEVTKEIAQTWREMSDDEKQPYFDMYEKAKAALVVAKAPATTAKAESKEKKEKPSKKGSSKKEVAKSKSESEKKPAKAKK